MKHLKKLSIYSFVALLFVLCMGFCGFKPTTIVNASSTPLQENFLSEDGSVGEPTTPSKYSQAEVDAMFEVGRRIETTDMSDKNLYSELLSIVEDIEIDGKYYQGGTLYAGIFTELKDADDIVVSPAVTSISIKDCNISSLSGLELFRLEAVTSLEIVDCELTSVSISNFEKLTNLENLNLASNKIESCNITNLKRIRTLNLSGNQLSQIDLSNINTKIQDINLANNLFSSMSSIVLNTRADSISLNIISNNIIEINDNYFTSDYLKISAGVQGLMKTTDNAHLDTATPFKYYKTNVTGLSVKIYKETEEIADTLVATISDADVVDKYYSFPLSVGSYYYLYAINDEEILDQYDPEYSIYSTQAFKVLPQTAKYTLEFKGKTYETLGKVTGKVTIHLTSEENSTIYYSVGGGEWTEGNMVLCDQGGNYSVNVKVVKDGVESEITNIYVKTSLNTLIPDIVMLIIILFFALTLFLVVVPLVSKKYFKKY